MNVVSNTSPLTNLAAIGHLEVLRQLYGRVVIAEAVWHELNVNGGIWPGAAEVAAASWIEQCQPTNNALIITLQRDLDAGEAASIALALEINADIILLDERDGRHAAQRLKLKTVGVIGVLLEAKNKGLINDIKPLLDRLRAEAGFYLHGTLYAFVLNQAGEMQS